MLLAAVDLDHGLNGAALAAQAGMFDGHGTSNNGKDAQ